MDYRSQAIRTRAQRALLKSPLTPERKRFACIDFWAAVDPGIAMHPENFVAQVETASPSDARVICKSASRSPAAKFSRAILMTISPCGSAPYRN